MLESSYYERERRWAREDEAYQQKLADRARLEEEDSRRTQEVIDAAKPNTNPPDRSDITSEKSPLSRPRANKTGANIQWGQEYYTPGRSTYEGIRDDDTPIGWEPVGQKVYTGRVTYQDYGLNLASGKKYYTNVESGRYNYEHRAITRGQIRTKLGEHS